MLLTVMGLADSVSGEGPPTCASEGSTLCVLTHTVERQEGSHLSLAFLDKGTSGIQENGALVT